MSLDQTAKIWNAQTGQLLFTLKAYIGKVLGNDYGADHRSAVYSPDGLSILTCSPDDITKVWDAQTGQVRFSLRDTKDTINGAEYSPDGSNIVTTNFIWGPDHASTGMSIKIWDAHTGHLISTLHQENDIGDRPTYSPDGHTIITLLANTVQFWDAQDGHLRLKIVDDSSSMTNVAYSPDSSTIVTSNDDMTAKVWDASTGALQLVLNGYTGIVMHAVYDPFKHFILTASRDGTAKMWDARTGHSLETLHGHAGVVNSAVFSPDGRRIVTAGADGTARQYLVNVDDLLKLAESRVTRQLTLEERARFLGEPLPTAMPASTATTK